MGHTLGKQGAKESDAALTFRRGVATVAVLNRIDKPDRPIIRYPPRPPPNDEAKNKIEDTLSVNYDVNNDDNVSRTIVYKDTTDAWAALKSGHVPEITATNTEFSLVDSALGGCKAVERVSDETKLTLESGYQKESLTFDVPYEPVGGWQAADQDDFSCIFVRCSACNKGGGVIHPCRVCDKGYHESCLTKVGRLPDDESRAYFNRARKNIGWSCHDCESLGSVLHQDDMMELIEIFEKADVDDDATIDLAEFIRYRRLVVQERDGRALTKLEEDDETFQFNAIDTDKTGTLSWWEFLNHESVRRLSTKPTKQLVKLLSEKEISKARQNFRAFDTDLDGSITEYEAKRAYKKWYANFISDPADMSASERRRLSMATDTQHTRQLNTHIQANTQLLMGADRDKSGTISWEEYLCEQALYIIAARPNLGPIKLKNRRPSFAY